MHAHAHQKARICIFRAEVLIVAQTGGNWEAYIRILCINKNEGTTTPHNNMEESHKYTIKWNKPSTKYMLYFAVWFQSYKIQKQAKSICAIGRHGSSHPLCVEYYWKGTRDNFAFWYLPFLDAGAAYTVFFFYMQHLNLEVYITDSPIPSSASIHKLPNQKLLIMFN